MPGFVPSHGPGGNCEDYSNRQPMSHADPPKKKPDPNGPGTTNSWVDSPLVVNPLFLLILFFILLPRLWLVIIAVTADGYCANHRIGIGFNNEWLAHFFAIDTEYHAISARRHRLAEEIAAPHDLFRQHIAGLHTH